MGLLPSTFAVLCSGPRSPGTQSLGLCHSLLPRRCLDRLLTTTACTTDLQAPEQNQRALGSGTGSGGCRKEEGKRPSAPPLSVFSPESLSASRVPRARGSLRSLQDNRAPAPWRSQPRRYINTPRGHEPSCSPSVISAFFHTHCLSYTFELAGRGSRMFRRLHRDSDGRSEWKWLLPGHRAHRMVLTNFSSFSVYSLGILWIKIIT